MANLYDHPLEFYVYACGGDFDAEKLTALGYNDAQLPVIEKYLADNLDGVKAAQANIPASEPAAEVNEPTED